ncbi:MAG: L-aspartate oxidase [Lentisphaeria bacterium]|jgi:L-aspartate oxidase
MTPPATERLACDFLVIGTGAAGLTAALKAARHGSVILIAKDHAEECNTRYAQGGIACVTEADDSFASHIEDTLQAGAGLCHEDVVRAVVEAAPERIQELIERGLHFTRRGEVEENAGPEASAYDLGREGGHSRRRILHAGDITGEELIAVLLQRCREEPRIRLLANHIAIDLISSRHVNWQGENCGLGAYVLDKDNNRILTILARHTFLATGGAGKVYLYTTNPDVATGDGIAMAWRAQADIANMEFYQFHPTCLYHQQTKPFLISEAVRGEGATLKVRRRGDYVEFMQAHHEMGSLAPRDIVARAIDAELKRSGEPCAYLDIRHQDEGFLLRRFPNIFAHLRELGINMAKDLIPVVPAAHYCCGGVRTDVRGRTNVRHLYAVGEVGCTGLHGANRLASNSLLEALVVAHNAVAAAVAENASGATLPVQPEQVPDWNSGAAKDSDEQIVITHNWQEIRRFMWDYVGIVRTDKRLERAKNRISLIRREIEKYYWDFTVTADLVELRNLASVAEMIIDCARARRESRGLHYNVDCPVNSRSPGKDTILRRPTPAVVWME